MPKQYCEDCGKPLGNSADGRCHSCGGTTYRGGSKFNTGAAWKTELGLMHKLRQILADGGEEEEEED